AVLRAHLLGADLGAVLAGGVGAVEVGGAGIALLAEPALGAQGAVLALLVRGAVGGVVGGIDAGVGGRAAVVAVADRRAADQVGIAQGRAPVAAAAVGVGVAVLQGADGVGV